MTEFKKILKKKLINIAAFSFGFLVVAAVGIMVYGNNPLPERGTTADVMEIREHAPNSPDAVLAKHKDECWTSDQQPKAELPGAAIVQFNDGMTIYTKKHALVDAAFNEALAAVGYGDKTSDKLDVIALCI